MNNSNDLYNLVFEKELEEYRREIKITFTIDWKFPERCIIEQSAKLERTKLLILNIHIPNNEDRELFSGCIFYYAKESFAPILVEVIPHPGYPLVSLSFDSTILSKEDVSNFATSIMEAVVKADIKDYNYPESTADPEEDDSTDEEVIVEYEEDEELKKVMYKPSKTIISPLNGGETND